MADTFSLLVVCRANICRSPLAAHLLIRRAVAAGLTDIVVVRSAGTHADLGAQMCEQARAWAGIDSGPMSVILTAALLQESDLVLAADRVTASACAILDPACRPRLFTLNQAAVLARAVGPHDIPTGAPTLRLRLLVQEMDAARVVLSGRDEKTDDIPDRHGPDRHEEVFGELEAAASAVGSKIDRCVNSGSI